MLDAAPLMEVRGMVKQLNVSCHRREKRKIELLTAEGMLNLRVRRWEWPRAQEGRPFVTHFRPGLLGILWRWKWE